MAPPEGEEEVVSSGRHQVSAAWAGGVSLGLASGGNVDNFFEDDFASLDALGEAEAVVAVGPEAVLSIRAGGEI
jgi:hypothetical protein